MIKLYSDSLYFFYIHVNVCVFKWDCWHWWMPRLQIFTYPTSRWLLLHQPHTVCHPSPAPDVAGRCIKGRLIFIWLIAKFKPLSDNYGRSSLHTDVFAFTQLQCAAELNLLSLKAASRCGSHTGWVPEQCATEGVRSCLAAFECEIKMVVGFERCRPKFSAYQRDHPNHRQKLQR